MIAIALFIHFIGNWVIPHLELKWHYHHLQQTLCPKVVYPSKKDSAHNTIPLFQTFDRKQDIPQHIHNGIQKMSEGYQRYLWDDDESRCFLLDHFPDYLPAFEKLQGAHRADLLRYLFLYQFGGVYLDIKTLPLKPLKALFPDPYLYTSLAASHEETDWIYQGILASPAKNPFLLELADHIKNNQLKSQSYARIMQDFSATVRNHSGRKTLIPGLLNNHKHPINFYFFYEECQIGSKISSYICKKADRYGLCCYGFDKAQAVFLIRDPDFPWIPKP